MKKHIALIIPHVDYNKTEYEQIKHALINNNISVKTVSTSEGIASAYTPESYVVEEYSETTTHIDMKIDALDIFNWDGIILIGGPGALHHCNTTSVHKLLNDAHNFEKTIGAIGQSTRILAEAGILNNKEVTGWNNDGEFDSICFQYGAENLHQPVVINGNIITATGETAAQQLAQAVIDQVKKG